MSSENHTPDVEVTNWTLATGTRPGERHVCPTVAQSTAKSSARSPVMRRSLRSVVVVSGHSQRAAVLDALFDASDYDVVFVESIAHGYSRIKQVTPDLVIVLSEIDDVAACQLLSMLTIDGDLSRIPVVTCATRQVESEREEDIVERDRYSPGRTLAIPMN